ncbi:MAG TPA: glycosyltransferase [Methylotenera sp.]|nr:glycosyltransferase [Methylotenera sp.]
MLHVLNVNSFLDFKTGGGTAERTFQMSRHLASAGVECTVLTIDTGLDGARISAMKPAVTVALPLLIRRFFVPIVSWNKLRNLVGSVDIIHLMGHWSLLNALVYIAARIENKPYVVCPAGALPIFGRSRLIKKLYNFIVGNALIRNASGWIAVTKAEFPHFEAYGIDTIKVTVIANGVSEEDFLSELSNQQFRRKYQLSGAPIILFMGRLNPIKGPDLLLQAFGTIHADIGDCQLVFAGPDEGMQEALIDLAKQYGVSERVHFLGFINGSDKAAAYKAARLLVVPSRQEAMSIVALEAGICGTAVMLTDQCGFSEIKTVDDRMEVQANVSGIAEGLKYILSPPVMIDNLAKSFRSLVLKKYTWDSIVINYIDLYKAILISNSKT